MIKSKNLSFTILVLAIAGIILISGCVSEQTKSTESSDCPYDGVYSGLVSGSGEIHHNNIDVVPWELWETPYIITYSLEVTLECVSTGTLSNGKGGWYLYVTHAEVSDPFFGCTNGCTPENAKEVIAAEIPKPGERGGNLIIHFLNGAFLQVMPLLADPDAKRISADQSDHKFLVDNSALGITDTPTPIWIETYKCSDYCLYQDQQGFTMTLDKIS